MISISQFVPEKLAINEPVVSLLAITMQVQPHRVRERADSLSSNQLSLDLKWRGGEADPSAELLDPEVRMIRNI